MSGQRGNPNWKKAENETKELSLEELQARIKELESQLEVKDNNEDLIISDDTRIELRTNVSGKFILREDRGKANIFIPFAGYHSTARITYGDLRLIYGAKPIFFTKGKLAIMKIYSENKKITLKDVYIDMGLESLYLDNKYNPVNIEEIFSDKVSEVEFDKAVRSNKDISEIILEAANHLFKKGKFVNSTKQSILKSIFPNMNLFR